MVALRKKGKEKSQPKGEEQKHKHIKTIKEGAPHSSEIRGQCAGRNKKNEPYIASQTEESRKKQVSRKVGKGTSLRV